MSSTVLRASAVLVAALISIGLVPASAPAEGLSTAFVGTSSHEVLGDVACFAHQTFDATFEQVSVVPGTVHVDGCVSGLSTESAWLYSGTFTVTYHGQVNLRGVASGTIADGFNPEGLDFDLQLTSGLIAYRMAGKWHATGEAYAENEPIEGTLTTGLSALG